MGEKDRIKRGGLETSRSLRVTGLLKARRNPLIRRLQDRWASPREEANEKNNETLPGQITIWTREELTRKKIN